jgi:hypothetical protein
MKNKLNFLILLGMFSAYFIPAYRSEILSWHLAAIFVIATIASGWFIGFWRINSIVNAAYIILSARDSGRALNEIFRGLSLWLMPLGSLNYREPPVVCADLGAVMQLVRKRIDLYAFLFLAFIPIFLAAQILLDPEYIFRGTFGWVLKTQWGIGLILALCNFIGVFFFSLGVMSALSFIKEGFKK